MVKKIKSRYVHLQIEIRNPVPQMMEAPKGKDRGG